MNIAIDIRSLMEPQLSGVGEYTFRLVNHLLKADRENTYILWSNAATDMSKTAWEVGTRKWKKYPNVHICHTRYPNKLLNIVFLLFKKPNVESLINSSLKRQGKKQTRIDVFFMPNVHFISLKKDTRLVLTVHDLSYELYPKFFKLYGRIWHKLIRPKKLISRADHVIAVSENTKKDIEKFFDIDKEKTTRVYPGIRADLFTNQDVRLSGSLKEKYKIPNSNYILYLGTLEPRKNVLALITAYSILSNRIEDIPNLVIAGSPGWLYRDIYAHAKISKAKEKIHFTGYIEPDDKPRLYSDTLCFVYPSYYEGFGFPPLEACASGKPVVVSSAGSLPEVVGDCALVVDPYDTNDISSALKQIITDPNLRKPLGEKGYRHVQKYSWKESANDTLSILVGSER